MSSYLSLARLKGGAGGLSHPGAAEPSACGPRAKPPPWIAASDRIDGERGTAATHISRSSSERPGSSGLEPDAVHEGLVYRWRATRPAAGGARSPREKRPSRTKGTAVGRRYFEAGASVAMAPPTVRFVVEATSAPLARGACS
jgi:hypothetical protein